MSDLPVQPPKPKLTPWKGFVSVFLLVFSIVFLGSALITFNLPEIFLGVARVRVTGPKQVEVFQSGTVLSEVTEQLDLRRSFARLYGEDQPLTSERTVEMLRRSLRVRLVRGGGVVEIRVYSRNPEEAALLANTIAKTGVSMAEGGGSVLEQAGPAQKPARPNKVLNLVLGAIVGALLGVMAGGVGARLAVGRPKV